CRRQHEVFLVIRPQGTKIGENSAGYAEFLGQAEGHTERQRADIIFVAAERISGNRVTRPDAGRGEAAQIVAADKKPVLQEHLLAAPAMNVAGFGVEAQDPLGHYRVVSAEIDLVPQIAHTKAEAG